MILYLNLLSFSIALYCVHYSWLTHDTLTILCTLQLTYTRYTYNTVYTTVDLHMIHLQYCVHYSWLTYDTLTILFTLQLTYTWYTYNTVYTTVDLHMIHLQYCLHYYNTVYNIHPHTHTFTQSTKCSTASHFVFSVSQFCWYWHHSG